MNAKVFLDTNILVYAVSAEDERKRQRAVELLESTDFGLSAQVLQEFFVTVVRKATTRLSAAKALEWIQWWTVFPCQPTDYQLVCNAIERSERYKISYWDAAIVAAAEALGAQAIYSEDLSNGQQYGSVRVVNPFV